MIKTVLRTAILTALILCPSLARAGVVVEMEIRKPAAAGQESEVLSNARMFVEGDRVRFDPQVPKEGPPPQSILFVGSEARMLNIDREKEWYGEMNPALLEAMKLQLADALKEVERQLSQLPEEQRAAVEQRIAEQLSPTGAALPERTVRPTQEKRQVGSYPTVRYEVLQDGEKVRDVWVTDWSNVEGGKALRAGFQAVEVFIEAMVASLAELPRMEAFIQRMGDNALKELTSLPGFPVLSVQYEGGQAVQELVVTAVKAQEIEAAELAPPPGFSARNMISGVPN